MRATIAICILFAAAACQDANDAPAPYNAPTYEPPPVLASAEPVSFGEPQSTRATHNYDEQDGVHYSYIAAVSEEERKSGKRAGDVVTFAYLGLQNDRHVLARVQPNGWIVRRAACREPCRVITYDDGSQVGFDEGSIIGAAFADAIAGRLRIAEATPPSPTTYQYQTAPSPTPIPAVQTNESWTVAEAELVTEWSRLNVLCESQVETGQDGTACTSRDEDIAPRLAAANICYGKVYQDPASAELHRCTGDSHRFE